MKKSIAVVALILASLVVSVVLAKLAPTPEADAAPSAPQRMTGAQIAPSATSPCPSGKSCIWNKSGDNPGMYFTDTAGVDRMMMSSAAWESISAGPISVALGDAGAKTKIVAYFRPSAAGDGDWSIYANVFCTNGAGSARWNQLGIMRRTTGIWTEATSGKLALTATAPTSGYQVGNSSLWRMTPVTADGGVLRFDVTVEGTDAGVPPTTTCYLEGGAVP